MNAPFRRTLVVLASLAAAVAFVGSCSSPDPKPSAVASRSETSTLSPTTRSTPSTSSPSPTEPSPRESPKSSTTPAPKAPSKAPAPKLKRVDVLTTFAGWNAAAGAVEVGGYAAVVEPVGACTLKLVQGDKVVTRKRTSSTDATTAACGGFSVPGSELAAGTWQAILGYTSSTSVGEAASVAVKVP